MKDKTPEQLEQERQDRLLEKTKEPRTVTLSSNQLRFIIKACDFYVDENNHSGNRWAISDVFGALLGKDE